MLPCDGAATARLATRFGTAGTPVPLFSELRYDSTAAGMDRVRVKSVKLAASPPSTSGAELVMVQLTVPPSATRTSKHIMVLRPACTVLSWIKSGALLEISITYLPVDAAPAPASAAHVDPPFMQLCSNALKACCCRNSCRIGCSCSACEGWMRGEERQGETRRDKERRREGSGAPMGMRSSTDQLCPPSRAWNERAPPTASTATHKPTPSQPTP